MVRSNYRRNAGWGRHAKRLSLGHYRPRAPNAGDSDSAGNADGAAGRAASIFLTRIERHEDPASPCNQATQSRRSLGQADVEARPKKDQLAGGVFVKTRFIESIACAIGGENTKNAPIPAAMMMCLSDIVFSSTKPDSVLPPASRRDESKEISASGGRRFREGVTNRTNITLSSSQIPRMRRTVRITKTLEIHRNI